MELLKLQCYLCSSVYNFCCSQCLSRSVLRFPNDKILTLSIMKAFADENFNKMKIDEMMNLVFDKFENIVGNGENAGDQHFLLFPQCFQMTFSPGSLNVGILW